MMKAAAFLKVGGPEVIQSVELPIPTPGAEEVIIRTKAVGLNFADIYRRRGDYSVEPPAPYVLGYEGAGVVEAIGEGVVGISIGSRVGFAHVPRANAEYVKAPAWKVIPLPDGISFETAGSLLLQGLTAHYLTHDSFKVSAGDTVLVHSAAGGVGLLLLQICRMLGATAIGTVSSADKVAIAEKAGAKHVIVRGQNWVSQLEALTGGVGVDVVYDAIGTTLIESLSVTKPHGTVVYFGQAGGYPPQIDPNLLMKESKRLVGGELWSHISDREELVKRAGTLFSWVLKGMVPIPQATQFPLSRTGDAHRALESGKTQGKILLIP